MILKNSDYIMSKLGSNDVVLDIGGWAHPFNRANYVLDLGPYETRGYYNRTFARNNPLPLLGGNVEFFTKDTWIERDICAKEPYPFADKAIDYVICSHTLEDIRDPLWVCAEMVRIAKAGYVEVPSRLFETTRGLDGPQAGLLHHRWLIEIAGNHITFMQKFHAIHQWRYSLSKSALRAFPEEAQTQWLFWEDSFTFSEPVLHGDDIYKELEDYIERTRPHNPIAKKMDAFVRAGTHFWNRAVNKARRVVT
jgi:methionine biosynthesis protein MetW